MNKVQRRAEDSPLNQLLSELLVTLDESSFFVKLSEYMQTLFPGRKVQVNQLQENIGKSEGLRGHVLKTKKAYYSNALKRDPLHLSALFTPDIDKELCFPLISGGQILATIQILSCHKQQDFSPLDIEELKSLNKFLQPALSNMELLISAKELNQLLSKKLQDRDKELRRFKGQKSSRKIFKACGTQGQSLIYKKLLQEVNRVSEENRHLLFVGKSGTGKKTFALGLHMRREISEESFLVLDCSQIKGLEMEIKIFGAEKECSDESQLQMGQLEKYPQGTLFLSNFTRLSKGLQAKLFQFIKKGEFFRVGGSNPISSQTRVVLSSGKCIEKEISRGNLYREFKDFFGNKKVELPDLNQRQEDIILLADHFLDSFKEDGLKKKLTQGAISALLHYKWPENISELKRVMESAELIAQGEFIDLSHLPESVRLSGENDKYLATFAEMSLEDLEKQHIIRTLNLFSGNKAKVARSLKISVKTLYNKLHTYDLFIREFVESQKVSE